MKLAKIKPTQIQKVMRVLDDLQIQYMRADVEAQDKIDKKSVQTEVILFGAVFEKASGKYMFACPVANPIPRNGVM